jgi:hypothetical protein
MLYYIIYVYNYTYQLCITCFPPFIHYERGYLTITAICQTLRATTSSLSQRRAQLSVLRLVVTLPSERLKK